MKPIQVYSAAEQVALHLKDQIIKGEIQKTVPGVTRLAKLLGVNAKTVVSALDILEKEGLLLNQGPRRKRVINEGGASAEIEKNLGQIRLGVLLYEPADRSDVFLIELVHALADAGHQVRYAEKTLTELKMDLRDVEKLVAGRSFDAWLVIAGSRTVLEWFTRQPLPVFALFGRRSSLEIPSAGPKANEAFVDAVQHLLDLGHRRIVKVSRSERRLPTPGLSERRFLALLEANKIPVGDYNLPAWEETVEGYQKLLRSLFHTTPPTALILDESSFFFAAMQFLGQSGLRVPEDVSLFCIAWNPNFEWCSPSVACVRWESEPMIRRVLKWAVNVGNGKDDREQTDISTRFSMGGTIGPVLQEKE